MGNVGFSRCTLANGIRLHIHAVKPGQRTHPAVETEPVLDVLQHSGFFKGEPIATSNE